MNIFRKIYEDLLSKVHLDMSMKDRGVRLDVNLKDEKANKYERLYDGSFSLGLYGVNNPIGGVVLCSLTHKGESDDNTSMCSRHIIPNFTNAANLFLFLNGKLLPDNVGSGQTLADYIMDAWDKIYDDPVRHEYEEINGIVPLNGGYTLVYKLVTAYAIRRHVSEANDQKKALIEYLADCMNTVSPDATSNLLEVDVCEYKEENDTDDEDRGSKISNMTLNIVEKSDVDIFDHVSMMCDDKSIPLADTLAKYIYTAALSRIEDNVKEVTKSPDVGQIPWTNESLQQTKWLAKVKKSTKDPEAWKQVEEALVYEWK